MLAQIPVNSYESLCKICLSRVIIRGSISTKKMLFFPFSFTYAFIFQVLRNLESLSRLSLLGVQLSEMAVYRYGNRMSHVFKIPVPGIVVGKLC